MELIGRDDAGQWRIEGLRAGEASPFAPGLALFPMPGGRGCVLLAYAPASVNGVASLSLRWLDHRDEIRAGGRMWFFSAETPLQPSPFAAGAKPLHCACCKDELRVGVQVVRCPLCGAAYHEACWPYAPACSVCNRPTARIRWTPGEESDGESKEERRDD